MAAVRREGGKLVNVERGGARKPSAAPATPVVAKPASLPPAPALPRVFCERAKLVELLEEDRRSHEKLAQQAKAKRFSDEEQGARSVIAYILQLKGRLEGGQEV